MDVGGISRQPNTARITSGLANRRQRVGDHAVRLYLNMSLSDVKNALTGQLAEKLPEVNDSAVEGLKFASVLPDELARATVAERLADYSSMRAVLHEPPFLSEKTIEPLS